MIKLFVIIATILPLSLYLTTIDKKAIAAKAAKQVQPALAQPAIAPLVAEQPIRNAQAALPLGWFIVSKAIIYWAR
jgi:microcystin-dependent protein